ncbi:MAG: hypothetical protein ACRYFZ_26940 [Janthinobacterium lividum]
MALVLFCFLQAGFFYAIRRDKRWAKIVLAVLSAGAIIANVVDIHSIKTDFLNVLSYALYVVSHIWALMLLFTKPQVQVKPYV